MPTLAVDNFNIVCATLGGFITLFGLVSYLCKEKFYLSEARESTHPCRRLRHNTYQCAVISLVAGLIFSPHATNLIRPLEYAMENEETLATITLYFSRLVLGVQLVLAGVQLPSRYLKTEWKSLALLLGPGMTVMWIGKPFLMYSLAAKAIQADSS
jgi:sodium/hydrogen antiporter